MAIVVLNRRPIVSLIVDWLRDTDQPLLLVTARAVVTSEDLLSLEGRCETIALVDNYDGPVVEEIVDYWAKTYTISRVVSASEVDVIRAARIRQKLNLRGQDIRSASSYRDKLLMKSLLHQAGINVSPMACLTVANDLISFIKTVDGPVVIKPCLGGGSVGVRILSSEQDIERAVRALPALIDEHGAMMVEQWVQGRFMTVDGLMANGRIIQSWPSFTTANFEVVSGKSHLYSRMLTRRDPLRRDVAEFVASVIAVLPPIEELTAFHAELFLRPDGSLCLCEIACRPGGCGHVPVYEYAFGINLYAETLRGQAGLPTTISNEENMQINCGGFVWFPPCSGKLVAIPDSCPIPEVVLFRPTGIAGMTYSAPNAISQHVGQAFLKTNVEGNLDLALAAVGAWWDSAVSWS